MPGLGAIFRKDRVILKIMTIGDVVGSCGSKYLRKILKEIKKAENIDLVIANGENSADGNGITPFSANFLFDSGVDVITTGNHAFRRREIYDFFDNHKNLIRPFNYPSGNTPGFGYCVIDKFKRKVIIINLMGTIFMESLDCPFKGVNKVLNKFKDEKNIIIVDFHAEATSDKKAIGFYLDGRVSAIFGTHTHIPTADEIILEKGTGYITDVGMTGVEESDLGVKKDIIIKKLTTKMPIRFDYAKGLCKMDCAIFDIDENTCKTTSVRRFTFREK